MNHLCNYGCGSLGIYLNKSGKYMCSKSANSCPINKEKNSLRVKLHYQESGRNNKEIYNNLSNTKKENICWNKGLNKNNDVRVNRSSKTLKSRYDEGTFIPPMLGKKHSIQTREQLSLKAKSFSNGFIKCKWHKIFCNFLGREVNVQGSLEKLYAEYLNSKKINWIKPNFSLKYRDDIIRNYFPDFYLPDTNEYIEIKGFWFKNKNCRLDDEIKMKRVIECNPDKIIRILFKKDIDALIG